MPFSAAVARSKSTSAPGRRPHPSGVQAQTWADLASDKGQKFEPLGWTGTGLSRMPIERLLQSDKKR